MAAFEHVAPYYEVLFPARAAQLDALERARAADAPERWVDVACGTGQQLEALADRGHEVWGLELDEAMVARLARRRPDLAGQVVVGDMRAADRLLGERLPGPAGVVSCLGNALVQITCDIDIERAVSAMAALLDTAGALLVQIVNFDRVLDGGLPAFPPLERDLPDGGTITLDRRYTQSETNGCLLFHTRLVTPAGTLERAHDLRALRRDELAARLAAAGLHRTDWYGDYDGSAWSPAAPATIVRAARATRRSRNAPDDAGIRALPALASSAGRTPGPVTPL